MGVKLFAWLGGIAMFFGVVFFVKYTFERDLIPPSLRVTLGFIAGLALLFGGYHTHRRKKFRILAQALCATGVLVLYGVSFAAHAHYRFALFSQPVTLLVMVMVTITAFLTAVRFNARMVAGLGMIGGFLSPLLLPVIQDSSFALFSYVALLDIGILACVRVKKWKELMLAAAIGTIVIQVQWFATFFSIGGYDQGTLTLVPMIILLFFCALFGIGAREIRRLHPDGANTPTWAALVINSAAMLFAFSFLGHDGITDRPLLLYGFVLLLNILPIGISIYVRGFASAQLINALATFAHLAGWTLECLDRDMLGSALIIYLLFGLLHAGSPLLQRWLLAPREAGNLVTRLFTQNAGRDIHPAEGPVPLQSVLSMLIPFGLLILATLELGLRDPGPVFLVALLLAGMITTTSVLANRPRLLLAALAGILLVELVWHDGQFDPFDPWGALVWYLGIYGFFTLLPHAWRRGGESSVWPWITSALAAIGHFLLVHNLVSRSFDPTMGSVMGLVPFGFALTSMGSLTGLHRRIRQMGDLQRRQLAWSGAISLLFVTLIFPIQFDRQWLTIAWALEGTALVWLYRKVSHRGLITAACLLLGAAFIRLSLNPAVITDYPRSGTAILNWHLYTYGIVSAALVAAARWLPDEAARRGGIHLPATFLGLAGVLLFLLLNVEIADFFTKPGERFITFQFGGNFARDMTYSIAWGLFSLGLLGIGILKKIPIPRYAAIGLLAVTLLKVFLHDLARIENIYRIGALVGVAIIAFITSFLYQKFHSRIG